MTAVARQLMNSFKEDEAFDAADNAARRARAGPESDDRQGMSAATHQPSPLHLTDTRLHKHERGGRQASAHKAEHKAAQWMRRVCSRLRPAAAAAAGAHADSDADDDEVCCRQPPMNPEPLTAAAYHEVDLAMHVCAATDWCHRRRRFNYCSRATFRSRRSSCKCLQHTSSTRNSLWRTPGLSACVDRYAPPCWYAVSCALTSMIRAAQLARWLLMHWLQDGIDQILDTEELVCDAEDMSTRMQSVVTQMRANGALQKYFPSSREGGGA